MISLLQGLVISVELRESNFEMVFLDIISFCKKHMSPNIEGSNLSVDIVYKIASVIIIL